MLKEILAISGRPGLYKLVKYGKNVIIVESIIDKKRTTANQRDKVISLGDISMYTESGDKPLGEILEAIKAKYDAIEFSYFDLTEFTLYKEKTAAFIEREKEMQEEERQRLERRKAEPHCDDFASVYIDKSYFLNNGILKSGTQYIVEHTDTYCDGTVLVETDVNDTYSDDPDNTRLAFTVGYGKNDDAPCHIHVRCRPKDKQEYIDLFDIDIDFKNKTYDCGDIMFSDSIRVEYVYFSECYNNE